MKSIKIFIILFITIIFFIYCNQSKNKNIPQIYINKGIECIELYISNPVGDDNRNLVFPAYKKLDARIICDNGITNMYIFVIYNVIELSEKWVWHLRYSDSIYYVYKTYAWNNDKRLSPTIKTRLEDINDYILTNIMATSNRHKRQKYFEKIDLEESERWKKKIFRAIRNYFKSNPELYDKFGIDIDVYIYVGMGQDGKVIEGAEVPTPSSINYIKLKDKNGVEYITLVEGFEEDTNKEIQELKIHKFSLEKDYYISPLKKDMIYKKYKLKLK